MRSLPDPLTGVLAACLPGGLYRRARSIWHGEFSPEYEVVDRWSTPAVGWSHESVRASERATWPRHVAENHATGVLGAADSGSRIGAGRLWWHNVLMSYAYALTLAARERTDGSLSVLDWGGGVGYFRLTAGALLPGVEIRYEVKDLPALAQVGRELNPDVRFHEDDACLERRYDIVVASGSLQYSERWPETLARLGSAADPYLFIGRLPTVFEHPSFMVRQRAYATQYVGWMVNRGELLAAAQRAGLVLVREFLGGEEAAVRGAPEQFETRAFLFRKDGAP